MQDGEERFLGAWGRKCYSCEANYASYKEELLAVIKAMEFYSHLLRGREFRVVSDAIALREIHKLKDTKPIFMRWYESLAGYNFTVTHKKGVENQNADALSRSEHLPEPTQEECEEAEELLDDEVVIKFTDPIGEVDNLVSEEISAADLQAAQEADQSSDR